MEPLASDLRWLFLDLNAYFASVEQQRHPELRGKPVAVVPSLVESTCCIAVSYEAKAFGIKTGTLVAEARLRCPSIHFIEGDHAIYTQFHHRIVEAVDSCIPVESILSIDEMICRLTGSQTEETVALGVARRVKQTIYDRVGSQLRCSVGLAPNRYLAKVAGEMQKPDGLTVLHQGDLPYRLYGLALEDLPGIGPRMGRHLRERGISQVEQLCALGPGAMRTLWGGIWGERMYGWLRGEEIALPETQTHTLGHSHVLEPELRCLDGAGGVLQRLTAKAGMRLRRKGYWAGGISVHVRWIGGGDWDAHARLPETQDTPTLLKTLAELWKKVPNEKPLRVGMTLQPLIPAARHTPSLFDNPKREKLSHIMDQINERHGQETTWYASLANKKHQTPTRIAFNRIPEMADF